MFDLYRFGVSTWKQYATCIRTYGADHSIGDGWCQRLVELSSFNLCSLPKTYFDCCSTRLKLGVYCIYKSCSLPKMSRAHLPKPLSRSVMVCHDLSTAWCNVLVRHILQVQYLRTDRHRAAKLTPWWGTMTTEELFTEHVTKSSTSSKV